MKNLISRKVKLIGRMLRYNSSLPTFLKARLRGRKQKEDLKLYSIHTTAFRFTVLKKAAMERNIGVNRQAFREYKNADKQSKSNK